jgi:hypothetical protein
MRANHSHLTYIPRDLLIFVIDFLGDLGDLGGSMIDFLGILAVKAFRS